MIYNALLNNTKEKIMKILNKVKEFLTSCPRSLGHCFGPVSDLCLNEGCNAAAGTWKPCLGINRYQRKLQPVAPDVPLDEHLHRIGEYCVGCAQLLHLHSDDYRKQIEGRF